MKFLFGQKLCSGNLNTEEASLQIHHNLVFHFHPENDIKELCMHKCTDRISLGHKLIKLLFGEHGPQHAGNLLELLHADIAVLVSVKYFECLSLGIRNKFENFNIEFTSNLPLHQFH